MITHLNTITLWLNRRDSSIVEDFSLMMSIVHVLSVSICSGGFAEGVKENETKRIVSGQALPMMML